MDYHTKTQLILPFKGTWMVTNGGGNPLMNNHNRLEAPKNQLYAYDFRKGHHGLGKNLEDYEVFGEKVLAPAGGVIVQIIDGAIDVLPGERDRNVGVGNTVAIDHKNGEWSVFCHFKYRSIKVKIGDQITQGDVLGLCGNTGNTSEPHIHFHLQDGPFMHKSNALPVQFTKILVDGIEKTNYEPVRGQLVSNP